jgi:hypothetical protein
MALTFELSLTLVRTGMAGWLCQTLNDRPLLLACDGVPLGQGFRVELQRWIPRTLKTLGVAADKQGRCYIKSALRI